MHRIHIIGRKNHGKTSLIVELIEEFTRRGIPVGAIKHTHHHHELDTPGKDSHRHREAGAAVIGVLSREMSAVFLPRWSACSQQDRYARIAPLFSDCRLVLVEGDSEAAAPKIEVWRASLGTAPMVQEDASIEAVVTDDACPSTGVRLGRANVIAIADWILSRFDQ